MFRTIGIQTVFLLLVLFSTFRVSAQKVGLVLSGGGAKGIAHVGVLKALEEHQIPIDYIVGTSMGGIVAGCYAAGMSPDQIEAMVLSDDFARWVNGEPDKEYSTYYYSGGTNPSFSTLTLTLDSAFNARVNTSLAKDVTLNFALAEKLAQAEAISNRIFDSLFIPIRVVAADVFSQTQVVLSSGSLSKALRATQTVPFFYTPIRIEGKYLFDGGVYNNFPVDVMKKEFNPDVIIGSNVSSKIFDQYPYEKDDALLNNSLVYMFLDKSNPDDVPASGIYLQPNLVGYTAIDFSKARSLIDSGYQQTLKQIDEINTKVVNRVSCENLTQQRNTFTNSSFPFAFHDLKLSNFSAKQKSYISRLFGFPSKDNRDVFIGDIKTKYFDLVSEPYLNNVYPTISFNNNKRKFVLELAQRKQKNLMLDFGGIISTRDISNIYLGLNYYHFSKQLTHAYLGVQSGNFYKSFVTSVRMDYPTAGRFFLEPQFVYNNWNYTAEADLFQNDRTTLLKRIDRSYALVVGKPLAQTHKLLLYAGGINNIDNYINGRNFNNLTTLDELRLSGFKTGFTLSADNLNRKQYASKGRAYSVGVNFFDAQERYSPGNTSVAEKLRAEHTWFTAKLSAEKYFSKGKFRQGLLVEAAYTSLPMLVNYQGYLLNVPAFNPMVDSRTLFLENFRAKSYLAGGGRLIVAASKKVDWRLEGYIFKPLESIEASTNQQAVLKSRILDTSFAATTSLVYHSPIGPISLMLNYYDDRENELGVLLHVGYLLFKNSSIE